MIRLTIDGFALLLPGKWEELKQEQACKILELRNLGLAKHVFYWQVLKLLLEMPEGRWYSLLYFLIRWKWMAKILMKNRQALYAKWKLVMKAEDEDQIDVLKFLSFLETKPEFKSAPELVEDLSAFQRNYHAKAWVQKPDDEGKFFNFEQLVDAILYYTNYSKNETEEDLDRLIAAIYYRVDGHYNPVFLEYFAKRISTRSYGFKMRVYLWFVGFFKTLVDTHPHLFPEPVEGQEPSSDPYGMVGFMQRLAGKQFGTLEQLKKTCGLEVFDGLEIEVFDSYKKEKPAA
jgi:hypothetical protein